MVALPTSAKLKSDVPTRSIGRHRVRTGAVSPGDPALQRQIEFHTRPVFMRPEFVVGRSKRIQQYTDARSGSRDRPLMNITHFHGPDPGMKSTKAQVYDRGPVPESHHNLRAASAFAISFRTPNLWNGTTKKS